MSAHLPPLILYRHAGDLGDLIYGLVVCKHVGPGAMFIEAAHYTRQRLTPANYEPIIQLLQHQPYCQGVYPFDPARDTNRMDLNLNEWRAHMWSSYAHNPKNSMVRQIPIDHWHLKAFGLPVVLADEQWLCVNIPARRKDLRVLINRSPRYQNPLFPWGRVLAKYRDCMAFVGLPAEYVAFCRQFQVESEGLPFLSTIDLFELARLIAACRLFIGNQSAPYAIAEGLKRPAVLEVFPKMPNCIHHRPLCWHGWDDTVHLPDVEDLPDSKPFYIDYEDYHRWVKQEGKWVKV